MPRQSEHYLVHGTLTGVDGKELSGARVTVWWQHIRRRTRLVSGKADEEGVYRLRFRPRDDAPGPMLIVVEARSPALHAPLESPLTAAKPDMQIDLAAQPRDSSEFAGLLRAVEPLLDKLTLLDVVEDDEHGDLAFLSQETGRTTEQIMRLVVSARLHAAHDLPSAAFFAFLRQRVPAAMPSPLLEASQGFSLIDPLVRRIASLIFALSADLQTRTLQTAVQQRLIGPHFAKAIPELVNRLQALRTVDVLNQPYLVGKATLGQLLDVAGLPKAKQTALAAALVTNAQSMRKFWRTLGDGEHGFTPEEASGAQRALELGAFVKNHLPLVQALDQRFSAGTYRSLHDLARLSLDDWEQLVAEVGPPPNVDGAGTASSAEVYARVIYTRVTRSYPTPALVARVLDGQFVPESQRTSTARFFSNNPTLELSKNNLAAYLDQAGEKAFDGIAPKERPAVVANAKHFQRVLRLQPDVDTAHTLLELNISSATQIAVMGRQQFFNKATSGGLTPSQANRLFDRGAQRYAELVSTVAQYNRDLTGLWPSAVGQLAALDEPTANAIQRDQSLATLFGSQDFCEVDACTSVLSPAAYLTDLLLWLRNHPQAGPFPTALRALLDRRPDIGHLLLNCPNTETPLPYIDLVNELLEDAVSPPGVPVWKQTTRNAAELRAAPEHVNASAYTVLAAASYPHTLPYDAPLDELRTYLQQSGVGLWQLRAALLPLHSPSLAQQASVAAERFEIDPHELDLITQANFVALTVAWNTVNPLVDLTAVPAFLQAGSLTYESLLELLDVVWVRAGGAATQLQGVDDTCDTSVQTLSPLDVARLDRMHRFLRLWRHTGWRMWELDLLLAATRVGNNTLDAAALAALFNFRVLQDTTHLAVDQQLAFFQDIDLGTHREPDGTTAASLYSRLFLAPAVPDDADLAAIQSGAGVTDPLLQHHLPAIQAALQVSTADANALFALTDGQLTLANLSQIYRTITLARVAAISLSDLLAIAPWTTFGALTAAFASPAATSALLVQLNAVQKSGFSVDALVYLLRPPPWTTTTGITDADVISALTAVRGAILNPSGGDVDGSVTAAVASALDLTNDVAALLVQQLQVPATARTLLSWLTDPALTAQVAGVYTPITRANFPNQFLALELLDKAALVIGRLHLVRVDLEWLLANAAVYRGLDFQQLPVTGAQPPLSLGPLLQTILLVQLARLFTAAPPQSSIQSLYDVFSGVQTGSLVNEASAQAALATITGWPLADVVALAAALGLSFAGGDYLDPSAYDSLRTLETMVTAFGQQSVGLVTTNLANAAQLVSWGVTAPDAAAATSAQAVLKSAYTNDAWLAFAPTLVDPIRERRSAALQGWLLAQRDGSGTLIYGDTNALFEHFLIDVQMSACEVTTRVIQAYAAVQLFVERCLLGLEAPNVVVDISRDDTWNQWSWMKRYRVWEANRQVFLYPENWLIESQRPSRTELFKKLEQEVHQNDSTADYLETVALNYIDRLDEIAHLLVTGTCNDPITGAIHVVARSLAEPPRFYHRVLADGAWTGWQAIPLDIKAHQVVPAIFRRRLCLFWPDVKVSSEPHQNLPAAQASSFAPPDVAKFVSIGLDFTIFRNGSWAPAQKSRGKLFDVPLLTSQAVSDSLSVEALYTLKVQTPAPTPGYGATLFIDVFRLGDYDVIDVPQSFSADLFIPIDTRPNSAVHIGRAIFDGRLSTLELRNLEVAIGLSDARLLSHAQSTYGPDAQPLLPLPDTQADPDLNGEPGLFPKAGALATLPADPNLGSTQTLPLAFTSIGALEQSVGPLLQTASVPFRVVGPDSDLAFDPTANFFYQDARRCYFVESVRYYQWGSAWLPIPPSDPSHAPFQVRYRFHRFYHPYTRLFWHELSGGGFAALLSRNLQLSPDTIDPSGADVFSFASTYQPVSPRVDWGQGENLAEDRNREIVDFSRPAAYSVYNWELFFHAPLYIAERLSQNQKFEDALRWFHYIFDPTRQGPEPVPQRFWITKPLTDLTTAEILKQRINQLLLLVNRGDPNAVGQVNSWRRNPFNPFLLADQRPVAYMKRVVMSYLDNLIAWADNLFSSDSREALNEATLLYVLAAEILGPQPLAITPPPHADDSYLDLEPKLDAFANALVDIENVIGSGGSGGGGGSDGGMPTPQTFYFKVPPNEKLVGYWKTVANRLFKLRHCQNIAGATRQLALFDAPIDPGLLIKAQAAGVDIGSVLSDLTVALPNYRFSALYPQALDFVGAVRQYGSQLLAALEKGDAEAMSVLLANQALQLQQDIDQILEWKIAEAQRQIESLTHAQALAQAKYDDAHNHPWANPAEITSLSIKGTLIAAKLGVAIGYAIAGGLSLIPNFALGVAGFGGSPAADAAEGGENAQNAAKNAAKAGEVVGDALDKGAELAKTVGEFVERADDNAEKAKEAQIQIAQTQVDIAAATLRFQIATQERDNHQRQVDRLQAQIDFLTSKFTSQDLYDWMLGELADVYFQSYQLAYKLCKGVERCYRYELGVQDSSFIQFGYWDSLKKGLMAGEALNHSLRRVQAAYLEQNARRFEISRFVSLAALSTPALTTLKGTGVCTFDLLESLFDHDYPGHFQRRLVRVSLTVVYPNPGKFDNVRATLILTSNSVRISTDTSGGYGRSVGTDARFVDQYAAVPQKIVLGQAQDDPGLFLDSIADNLADPRYLPFEGAGAISSWRLEMPAANNDISLAQVSDVVIHLRYTARDGGDTFKSSVPPS